MDQAPPDWLTVSEAAKVAGRSVSTIRSWYRSGRIESRMANEGQKGREQRLVRRSDLDEAAAQTAPHGTAQEPSQGVSDGGVSADLAPLMRALPELIRDLQDATDRAARAETKAEHWQEVADQRAREIEELRSRVSETPEPERATSAPRRRWWPRSRSS